MSSLFEPQASDDVWFRVGRLGVTTSALVALMGLVGMVATAFVPGLMSGALLATDPVLAGQVWRLVSWPFPQSIGLFTLLNLFFLWYFGSRFEQGLGRNRMLALFAGIWAAMTITTLVVGLVLPDAYLLGLDGVEFIILLLFILENPRAPFFFGIPAWVFGAVLLGLQVLTMLANRSWGMMLATLLGLAASALVARRFGLLGGVDRAAVRAVSRQAPRAAKPTRDERRRFSDEDRLDELLGKISAEGIHSLSKSERRELDQIRERRRR